MKMADSTLVAVWVLAIIQVVLSEVCYDGYSQFYCASGCCGTNYEYCCYYYYYSATNYSGVITGAVIGSIAFVGILVTLIVCVVCRCNQRGPMMGRTFGRTPGVFTTTTAASNNMGMTYMSSAPAGSYPTQAYPAQPPVPTGMYGPPTSMTQPVYPAYATPPTYYTTSSGGVASAPYQSTAGAPPSYDTLAKETS